MVAIASWFVLWPVEHRNTDWAGLRREAWTAFNPARVHRGALANIFFRLDCIRTKSIHFFLVHTHHRAKSWHSQIYHIYFLILSFFCLNKIWTQLYESIRAHDIPFFMSLLTFIHENALFSKRQQRYQKLRKLLTSTYCSCANLMRLSLWTIIIEKYVDTILMNKAAGSIIYLFFMRKFINALFFIYLASASSHVLISVRTHEENKVWWYIFFCFYVISKNSIFLVSLTSDTVITAFTVNTSEDKKNMKEKYVSIIPFSQQQWHVKLRRFLSQRKREKKNISMSSPFYFAPCVLFHIFPVFWTDQNKKILYPRWRRKQWPFLCLSCIFPEKKSSRQNKKDNPKLCKQLCIFNDMPDGELTISWIKQAPFFVYAGF